MKRFLLLLCLVFCFKFSFSQNKNDTLVILEKAFNLQCMEKHRSINEVILDYDSIILKSNDYFNKLEIDSISGKRLVLHKNYDNFFTTSNYEITGFDIKKLNATVKIKFYPRWKVKHSGKLWASHSSWSYFGIKIRFTKNDQKWNLKSAFIKEPQIKKNLKEELVGSYIKFNEDKNDSCKVVK